MSANPKQSQEKQAEICVEQTTWTHLHTYRPIMKRKTTMIAEDRKKKKRQKKKTKNGKTEKRGKKEKKEKKKER